MKKLLPLLLLFAMAPVLLFSQKLDHMLGEALIRLEPNANIQTLSYRLQTFKGRNTQFSVMEEVSPYMRIWRINFDYTTISEIDFLAHLNRTPGIEVAQYNHLVDLRSTV
ncbi:MAG: hypothetical protein HRU12_10795, partial [Phaeodactylibacter sp.]|nr:hypothetical protein [Phaeodactylibacter sp.]